MFLRLLAAKDEPVRLGMYTGLVAENGLLRKLNHQNAMDS